jgi:ABC-2 type transport system ATP-binding protein
MIKVSNLTKKFGAAIALNDISFRVGDGEIFGYLGPNGAGKTTTMRIILGLLKPTSGKALVKGKDLSTENALRSKVGVLLESDGLYDRLTAYENLDYYARIYDVEARDRKIIDLLEFAGLAGRKDEKVGGYSRGMKRKLGLARAIIHDPDIIFFDEPSAGLDPEAQKMVRDLIVNLSREKKITIFLNSHDLDEVQRICSRIAILKNGNIMLFDTVESLRNRLEAPSIEIVFADKEKANMALGSLREIDRVSGCEQRDNTLIVTLKDNESSSALLSTLVERGIEVEEMRKVTRSLEEIYLETVSGKNIHE